MSASNWTICPACVNRSKGIRDEFVKKYYGKLDSYVYGKILAEINDNVEYMKSKNIDKYEPNKQIIE